MDRVDIEKLIQHSESFKCCIMTSIKRVENDKSINSNRNEYIPVHTQYSKTGKLIDKVRLGFISKVCSKGNLIFDEKAQSDVHLALTKPVLDYIDRKTSLHIHTEGNNGQAPNIENYYRLSSSLDSKEIEYVLGWIDEVGEINDNVLVLKKTLICCKIMDLLASDQLEEALSVGFKFYKLLTETIDERIIRCFILATLLLSGIIGGFEYDHSCFSWLHVKQLFQSIYCKINNMSVITHLESCFDVGIRCLLPLSKINTLLKNKDVLNNSKIEELPATIAVPGEIFFHSLFSCPVLRVQSTNKNPPMMLQCGHVICRDALSRLSKGNSFMYIYRFTFRKFKCPYCPIECTSAQCVKLSL